MNTTAPYGAGSSRDAWSAPSRALRLEKPRETGRSANEGSSGHGQFGRRRYDGAPTAPSRFETPSVVSPWHGTPLDTAFAAQVIAQALHIASPQAPGTAYRRPIPPALLLDTRV